MNNSPLKLILLCACLCFLSTLHAQKHEVGINGGGTFGYPKGKNNNNTLKSGWSVGGYYRYTFNKWVGVESGLEYARTKYVFGDKEWENALTIPLNAIVFPSFRFSLFGGIYLKNRLETTTLLNGSFFQTNTRTFYQVEKKPVWGYTAGIKWNMKHCRLAIFGKQDLNSWIKDFDKVLSYEGWYLKEPFKSFSINIALEIPLWRQRKKHEME